MLDKGTSLSGNVAASSTATTVTLDAAEHEMKQQQFQLVLSEVKHDRQLWEIYCQNKATHSVNVMNINTEWSRKLADEATVAVQAFWDKHATGFSPE